MIRVKGKPMDEAFSSIGGVAFFPEAIGGMAICIAGVRGRRHFDIARSRYGDAVYFSMRRRPVSLRERRHCGRPSARGHARSFRPSRRSYIARAISATGVTTIAMIAAAVVETPAEISPSLTPSLTPLLVFDTHSL